jgi:hypothetical protein
MVSIEKAKADDVLVEALGAKAAAEPAKARRRAVVNFMLMYLLVCMFWLEWKL